MTPGIRAIDMNRTLGQCGLSRGASSALLVLTPFLLALPQLAVAPGEPVVLLDSARAEVAANATNFSAMERTDALFTKLAILESQTDAGTALNRARAIRNPFYSSLALGGIAATAIRSNPSAATNHFCEALVTSRGIKHWTGIGTWFFIVFDIIHAAKNPAFSVGTKVAWICAIWFLNVFVIPVYRARHLRQKHRTAPLAVPSTPPNAGEVR